MSTASSIGREERKPLLDAYLFERRILFGSTILVGVAMIFWIIAISTDHWYMISVKNGAWLSNERKFFMHSNAGLWRICRYSSTPSPLVNATIGRNFTFFQSNKSKLQELKSKISSNDLIKQHLNKTTQDLKPTQPFDDDDKQKMFAFWINDRKDDFELFKKHLTIDTIKTVNGTKEVIATPLDKLALEIENQIINITSNSSVYYVVMPRQLINALFTNWNEIPDILWVLVSYARELGISPRIFNKYKQNIIMRPPNPPAKGSGQSNGYEYKIDKKCRYIDMFPSDAEMESDLSVDEEILDYIRTQASFACITVIIMCMGCVFSGYTFLNPRYMFKRLAGGIHFISAATTIVVIQVLVASVDYRENHLQYAYPKGAERTYGYGVYIAWFVFIANLFASIMFMWYSKKKKGNKAPTDEIAMADEAINIGR